MNDEFFAELDAMQDAPNTIGAPEREEETRPHLKADLGTGIKDVILYPPKEHLNEELSFNQLVTMMKEHETIPLGIGSEIMFVGWDEARVFFKTLLDQFLVDHFGIFPTDTEEKDA